MRGIRSRTTILSEFEYLFPPENKPPSAAETGLLTGIELSDREQLVLNAIDNQQVQMDDIIRNSGLTASVASVTLLGLEMKRLVQQLPGKVYQRVR
jgi:predicted Rossmann fold nucleotide-binding protein DprA/Smf involved in DNA uptake